MEEFQADDVRKIWNFMAFSPENRGTEAEVLSQLIPSLLLIEVVFYTLAISTFLHALFASQSKRNFSVWIKAFFTGIITEVVFISLVSVNNFWHAQCMWMITPRIPLYIIAVYVSILYISTIASWRFHASRLSPPGIVSGFFKSIVIGSTAGILGLTLYAPFDVVGVKYLWWTWRERDPLVEERYQGVPIVSSIWILTLCFSFSTIDFLTNKPEEDVEKQSSAINVNPIALFFYSLLTIVLYVLVIRGVSMILKPFGQLDILSFLILLGSMGFLALIGSFQTMGEFNKYSVRYGKYRNALWKSDRLLSCVVSYYFLVLVAVLVLYNPADQISLGLHQPIGDPLLKEIDLEDHARFAFLPGDWTSQHFRIIRDEMNLKDSLLVDKDLIHTIRKPPSLSTSVSCLGPRPLCDNDLADSFSFVPKAVRPYVKMVASVYCSDAKERCKQFGKQNRVSTSNSNDVLVDWYAIRGPELDEVPLFSSFGLVAFVLSLFGLIIFSLILQNSFVLFF